MASTAGYIVSTSCKHIIDDQHWLSSAYTQFAVPYFIYDIYAMFLCHWHKHQVKGHGGDDGVARAPGSTWAIARGYLHKEFLMVLHHAAMVLVCFPLSVVWRQGKGDFFLGCMLMAEVSTPFVCLGKILIQVSEHGRVREPDAGGTGKGGTFRVAAKGSGPFVIPPSPLAF
uniref:TLC domain containing 3B n=1 Tax=Theropithecus gelada TaxID=9565 RepID=A0A8D2EUL7_THEGE